MVARSATPPPPPKPPTIITGGTPPDDEDGGSSSSHIPHPPSLENDLARRKEREEARQAAREAKQATLAAAKVARAERKALLKQGLAAFGYKVRAFENKKRKMRKALGLPEMKRDFTPEQRKAWNDYRRRKRAEALAKEQTIWTPAQWKA